MDRTEKEGSWEEFRLLFIDKMKKIDQMSEDVSELRSEMAAVKASTRIQGGLFGGAAGGVVTFITKLISGN